MVKVSARSIREKVIPKRGTFVYRALRNEGHAIHIGCLELAYSVPMNGDFSSRHMVVNVYNYFVVVAHL